MATSIYDLVKNISKEEMLDDILAIAKAVGLPTTSWRPGEPARAILTIVAEKLSDFWNNVIVDAIRAPFLDFARGTWLRLVAFAVYGVQYRLGSYAEPTITIQNQGGGLYVFVPGDLQARAPNGKTYTNVEGGTLASGSGQTLLLKFRADELGSPSSIAANTIVVTPAQGPANVLFTASTASDGQDEESDESLIRRCRLSSSLVSLNGPIEKYEYVCLSTRRQDGTDPERLLVEEETDIAVDVSRVRLVVGAGTVQVYIASPSGTVIAGDVALVDNSVQQICVPAGITATVASAVPNSPAYTVTLYARQENNVTQQELEEQAEAALEAFISDLPIGGHRLTPGGQGYLFASELAAVASESNPAVFRATISPNTDTALAVNEVATPTFTVIATLVVQN